MKVRAVLLRKESAKAEIKTFSCTAKQKGVYTLNSPYNKGVMLIEPDRHI